MPVLTYKVIHIIAVFLLIEAFSDLMSDSPKRLAQMKFGVASLLILIAGMGMVAKMGFSIMEPWVFAKLILWVLVSATVPMIAKRFPALKRIWRVLFALSLVVTVVLAVYKPASLF